MFKGLKIEDMETKWERYPVFEIDFNGSNYTEADALEQTLNGYLDEVGAAIRCETRHRSARPPLCRRVA